MGTVLIVIISIMALTSNKIFFLAEVSLSLVTSWFLMTIIYGKDNLRLWTENEYTIENITSFLSSDLAWHGFLLSVASYLFFYWVVPFVFSYSMWFFVEKKVDSSFKKTKSIESSQKVAMLRLINSIVAKKLKHIIFANDYKGIDYGLAKEQFIKISALTLHGFLCWVIIGFPMNPIFFIPASIFVVFLMLFSVKVFPHFKMYSYLNDNK